MTHEAVYDLYGIDLISVAIASPIKNTFVDA